MTPLILTHTSKEGIFCVHPLFDNVLYPSSFSQYISSVEFEVNTENSRQCFSIEPNKISIYVPDVEPPTEPASAGDTFPY